MRFKPMKKFSVADLLFSEMASLVVAHVALRPEAFSTILRAYEGPLVLVDPDVNIQVLLFGKGLAAIRKSALKGLRPIVQVHMRIQSNLATECLLTTVMRAYKCLLADTLHFKGSTF